MSSASSKPAQTAVETSPANSSRDSRVPWSPLLGLLVVGFLFYGAQIFAGTFVSIYPLFKKWNSGQSVDWLEHSVLAQFTYFLLAGIFTVTLVYLFLKFHKRTFRAIGLLRPRWRDLFYGLAALPAYFIFYIVTLTVAVALFPGLDINQKQEIGFEHVQGTVSLVLVFLSLVIIPPLMEEILMRGLLYSSLKKALPLVAAALATSFIFAVAHLPEGGASGPLYIAAVDTFVLSLVLIYLREKTGSLWASITLHAAKNGVAFLSLFVLHAR